MTKEEKKEYHHQWYLAHKAEHNRKSAEYNKAHPEQRKTTCQRYYTKKKATGARFTQVYTDDWEHVEGYDRMVADGHSITNMGCWDCHHRFEDMGLSWKDLIQMGLYFHRPACELIIMTRKEHINHHHKLRNNDR